MSHIQQYDWFMKQVEKTIHDAFSESQQILLHKLSKEKDLTSEEQALIDAKLGEYGVYCQRQCAQAIEKYKEYMKNTFEIPYQTSAHQNNMRQNRVRSKEIIKESQIDGLFGKVQEEVRSKRMEELHEYLGSFEEEFDNQTGGLPDEFKEIEKDIQQLQLQI